MINPKNVNKYCYEDPSLIENYGKAVNDSKMWDCHHRLETELGLTPKELKEQNKYFKVPASELIFLTPSEHQKLHKTGMRYSEESKKKRSEKMKGKNHPMYGKNFEDYMSEEAIKERRKKISENNGMKGKHPTWMNNGIKRVRPTTPQEIEHYLSLGYHIGWKLK